MNQIPLSLYDKLETYKTCSDTILKRQYCKLAKKYHPVFSSQANESKFNDVLHAYQILRNKKQRYFYDLFGDVGISMIQDDQTWFLVTRIFDKPNVNLLAFALTHFLFSFFSLPFIFTVKEHYLKELPYTGIAISSILGVIIIIVSIVRMIISFTSYSNLLLNHIILAIIWMFKLIFISIQCILGAATADNFFNKAGIGLLTPLFVLATVVTLENMTLNIGLHKSINSKLVIYFCLKPFLLVASGLVFLMKSNIYLKFFIFWSIISTYLILFSNPVPKIARVCFVGMSMLYLVGCYTFTNFLYTLSAKLSLILPFIIVILMIWRLLTIIERIKPTSHIEKEPQLEEIIEIGKDEEIFVFELADKFIKPPNYKSNDVMIYDGNPRKILNI